MNLFRNDEDFAVAIDTAAANLGVTSAIVEKDYWVTQALRALAEFPDDWIFKGGTSLSKAYGIIARFSEDIDVLVRVNGRGKGSLDRRMKDMATGTAAALETNLAAALSASSGVHRSYRLPYPAANQPAGGLSPSILVEMGVRGGSNPSEVRPILTLLGGALDLDPFAFSDLAPFEVPVLHPGRTLVEKLLHVHGVALRLSEDVTFMPAPAFGRHIYDIYKLLGDERVLEFLDDRDRFSQIVSEAVLVASEHFHSGEARPPDGFASSPAFAINPPGGVDRALVNAAGLAFPGEPWPTLERVRARVNRYERRL